ncbi:NTP transferase domain-containing protein [Alkalihalobacterium alkalinitrilicum]|uniref:NTP transferase domain-containing protein n=1 Tax=Alkalihalobacterium alkalinitrilicum TaxID=427920 RepID=UPI001C5651AE|nr:NTP transferase domain-containing protein [Alkalihalobacterium alkalinitrilicum]
MAAGQSKRMGCPKLNLPINGKPLGSISLKTALNSKLDKVIVVVNKEDPLSWLPSQFFNSHFSSTCILKRSMNSTNSQAESIKCGIKTAQKLQANAVMILLADQPFISGKLLNQLISIYIKTKPDFVASSFNGIQRPPIIINSSLFPNMLKLQGDIGARSIIRNSNQGIIVKDNEQIHFLDVDTPIQYQTLIKFLSKKV